jgi:membrane protein YdbS with pleckstrin-like domain
MERPRRADRHSPQVYVEDALVLLSLAGLFVLTVFFRDSIWGQVGLLAILAVMLAVLVVRLRRLRHAFARRDVLRDD